MLAKGQKKTPGGFRRWALKPSRELHAMEEDLGAFSTIDLPAIEGLAGS
jgi:hypothetical protein